MGEDWEPFLVYSLDQARTPSTKAAMRTLMKEVGVLPIPSEDLERITVPTILIWGRHDRAVRLRIAEDASARYGWPLHVIENAADDPKLEQPDAFLQTLYTALETTDKRRHDDHGQGGQR
jgi:pimeloyl-ACP methyl ester carboxylesterase